MSRDVEFIEPHASARDAAILTGVIEVGTLPVGTAARLDGIVTDPDLLYRIVASGRDASTVPVREVASRPVLRCSPEGSLRIATLDA